MNWRYARATAIAGCACSTATSFLREAKINIESVRSNPRLRERGKKFEGVPALLELTTAEESRLPGDLPEGWA